MRIEVNKQVDKVQEIIELGSHILKASEIAEKMNVSVGSVYKYIRILRERGFGVYSTPDGYLPTNQAQKCDDVRFLRRINGYHISSQYALAAAKKDIMGRWRGEKERNLLAEIIKPMSLNSKLLQQARTKLLTHKTTLV